MDLSPESTTTPPADGRQDRIRSRYLLLQGSTPIHVDAQDRLHLERLWAIDAREHAVHLADFTIASPRAPIATDARSMVPVVNDPLLSQIHFVALPHARSRWQALRQLPRTAARLWKAIGRSDVVHMGIAGWPYPLGWIGFPMARLRGKRVIVVVESAPWRKGGGPRSVSARLQEAVYETLGGFIARHADLSFFTTEQYRRSFGRADNSGQHVIEATWIPADQIIDDTDLPPQPADASPPREVRIGFFARLTVEKGVHVLAEAVRRLPASLDLTIDLYGDGPELAALRQSIAQDPALARLRLCGTLEYGPEFFGRIKDYDYVVVPNLGDEQPRIVFDAFSQAVPVLAADTAGLRQCVSEGTTGHFFRAGDASSLAQSLASTATASARTARARMAGECVQVARGRTHAAMHERRARVIAGFLQP